MSTVSESTNSVSAPNAVLGVIAGEGQLPVSLVQSTKAQGVKTVVLALTETARKTLNAHADNIVDCGVGQLEKAVTLLNQAKATEVVFIGNVAAGNLLFNMHKFDASTVSILTKLPDLNNNTLQVALGNYMESKGFKVLEQGRFLGNLLPSVGVLTKRAPTEKDYEDIRYGLNLAHQNTIKNEGDLVVVKNHSLLATNKTGGTDSSIRFAVRRNPGALIVCKASKINQDKRFYVSSVGVNTLKAMTGDKMAGSVLAIQAGETVVVELKEMVDYCDKHDFSFVVMPDSADTTS